MIQPIPTRAADRTDLSLVPRAPTAGKSAGQAVAPHAEMLNALRIQLRRATSAAPHAIGALGDRDTTAAIRASVMACAEVLDHLEHTLADDFAQRQRLELQVCSALAELQQAREELAGTQDGERQARHMALHDSLTALPNRRFFAERLAQALGAAAPRRKSLAVMYLDLDDFKPVNDRHGHATGDDLLRIIASRLSHSTRAGDTVSRLGGDEFACLLDGLVDRAQLIHLARKMHDAIAAPCKIGALQLQVRPSIGIALFPDDGVDAAALLHNADVAMYNAKRQRCGYAFFDASVHSRTRALLRMVDS